MQDNKERVEALNVSRSFIVEAPAGSGKTELLIARYAALLSKTDATPNEIVAITFTRKAAEEMKTRVLERLGDKAPSALALRIMTIDAFVQELLAKIPLQTGLLGNFNLVADPLPLYERAALLVFSLLETAPDWGPALLNIIESSRFSLDKVVNLFTELLSKREQWIRLLPYRGEEGVAALTQHWENLIESTLEEVSQYFQQDTLALTAICAHLEIPVPENNLSDLFLWKKIGKFCLTETGTIRKILTKSQGFLAPSDAKNSLEKSDRIAKREQFLDILRAMAAHSGVEEALARLLQLPQDKFAEQPLLQEWLTLLPVLLGALRLEMDEKREYDFTEALLRLIGALKNAENIDNLLFHLDTRIKHILIDEFQDTSYAQFELISLIVQDWYSEDGRTLFVVGDPMQSIYGFRGAEVSLFLTVKYHGIARLKPIFLRLCSNFRSSPQVVDFINAHFSNQFPKKDHALLSKVAYTKAVATQEMPGRVVAWDLQGNRDAALVEQIKKILLKNDDETIAILARKKRSFGGIFSQLRAAGISFFSPELTVPYRHPVVLEALNILYVLLDPEPLDWLALFRGSFVGLAETELVKIAQDPHYEPNHPRVQYVKAMIAWGQAQRGEGTLMSTFETLFTRLGGRTLLTDLSAEEAFLDFLHCLDQHDEGGWANRKQIERALQRAKPAHTGMEHKVCIFTIHQAKGLEFDTVIILGTEDNRVPTDMPIVNWITRPSNMTAEMIFAPFPERKEESVYHYIQYLLTIRQKEEELRLSYVAATRAKRQLIFAGSDINPEALPTIMQHIPLETYVGSQTTMPALSWPVILSKEELIPTEILPPENLVEWDRHLYQSEESAHAGEALHAYFAEVILSQLDCVKHWPTELQWKSWLAKSSTLEIEKALLWLEKAYNSISRSKIQAWLFKRRPEDWVEYPVMWQEGERFKQIRLDRMFIESGQCFIVDYKLKKPEHLNEANEYVAQLRRYKTILATIEERPIKLALYYVIEDLWEEVS